MPSYSGRVGGMFENSQGQWLFPVLKFVGVGVWGQTGTGNSGLAPKIWSQWGNGSPAENTNVGMYFNDQMTINDHWNVMLGLRYDMADAKNGDGSEIFKTSSFSPRFMLTYDPKGDSSHVFKFTYSRMTQDYTPSFSAIFKDKPNSMTMDLMWLGTTLNQPDPGTIGDFNGTDYEHYGLRFVTWEQLNDINNYGAAQAFTDDRKGYVKDSGLKPATNDEFAFEYRRNYGAGSYLRMAYVFKKMGNLWGGMTDYTPETWDVVTDPSNSGLQSMYTNVTRYFNTNEMWRDYHGLEFDAMAKMNSVFSWYVSYNYSRLRGSYDAGDGTYGAWGDYAPPGYFVLPTYFNNAAYEGGIGVPMSHRYPAGALPNDIPHKARATAHARVPLDDKGSWISYAMTFGYQSGDNWSLTNTYPMTGDLQDIYNRYLALSREDINNPIPPAPTAGWTKYYSKRGAHKWNDQYWIEATIAWEVPIWKKVKTMGNLTIWNLPNLRQQIRYNTDTSGGTYRTAYTLRPEIFGGDRNSNGLRSYVNSARRIGFSAGIKF